MAVNDISQLLVYVLQYCVPAAFVINLVSWGAEVIISAATGRGLHLNGRKRFD